MLENASQYSNNKRMESMGIERQISFARNKNRNTMTTTKNVVARCGQTKHCTRTGEKRHNSNSSRHWKEHTEHTPNYGQTQSVSNGRVSRTDQFRGSKKQEHNHNECNYGAAVKQQKPNNYWATGHNSNRSINSKEHSDNTLNYVQTQVRACVLPIVVGRAANATV